MPRTIAIAFWSLADMKRAVRVPELSQLIPPGLVEPRSVLNANVIGPHSGNHYNFSNGFQESSRDEEEQLTWPVKLRSSSLFAALASRRMLDSDTKENRP